MMNTQATRIARIGLVTNMINLMSLTPYSTACRTQPAVCTVYALTNTSYRPSGWRMSRWGGQTALCRGTYRRRQFGSSVATAR